MEPEALTEVLTAFLKRKYVQRAGRADGPEGLLYTTAETHDLGKELAAFLLAPEFEAASGGHVILHVDNIDGG